MRLQPNYFGQCLQAGKVEVQDRHTCLLPTQFGRRPHFVRPAFVFLFLGKQPRTHDYSFQSAEWRNGGPVHSYEERAGSTLPSLTEYYFT